MKSRGAFFIVILLILFLYTGFKAGHLLPERKVLAWFVTLLLFAVIFSWQFIYRSDATALNSMPFQILSWTGSLAMSLWATFLIFSLVTDIGHLLFVLFEKVAYSTPPNAERRAALTQWMSLGILSASAGISGMGYFQTQSGPKVKEVIVPIQDLPLELQGLKIAQISDLHVGSTIHHDYVEDVVAKVLGLKPDLIAVTGDLVDGIPDVLKTHLEPLAKLKAPLGTYYVTGNHEYYWGAEAWIAKARQLGFIPLLNENKIQIYNGIKILVGGVTDTSSNQFIAAHESSPKKAVLSAEQCPFKLLLAHRPDSCFEAEPAGFNLQLSGHTHAGQFFPWSFFVRLAHKYYQGLNKHGKMWVYVNAGTGYWGPANRFAIPSEITLIQLVRA